VADKTVNELASLSPEDFDAADQVLIWNSEDATTRKAALGDVLILGKTFSQGYFALLTNYYFTGGVATITEIAEEDEDTWVDVNFDIDPLGTFDNRPAPMVAAVASPFNEVTQYFSFEGLTQESSVQFRASMTFEPDEDEGQLEARLDFERHSGTTPSENFQIEDVALTMGQGADQEYPAEPLLTFFVGDTIDTNAAGDAGKCKFQVRSTVPGTVRMRALTWYISQ
jgi:hypothetical protein